MKVLYGVEDKYTDVTVVCSKKLAFNGRLVIPASDPARGEFFGDPLPYVLKHIKIGDQIWTDQQVVDIPFTPLENIAQLREEWWTTQGQYLESPQEKLRQLHSYLCIDYGDIRGEYQEQLMAMTYLNPDDVVLEIGGNIGRNSCVIATILSNQQNLTVLESSVKHAVELRHNRDQNSMNFEIIPAALSQVPLVQREWITQPLSKDQPENIPPGWSKIPTITYPELLERSPKKFNVLVLDCEGAIENILDSYPELLNGIDKILIENDFLTAKSAQKVHDLFREAGLRPIYSEPGGWGCCYNYFYQVWTK